MKQVRLLVEIQLSDTINDKEFNEVVENVMKALVDQVNHAGLSPEDSEAITEDIQISHNGLHVLRYEF